MLRTQICIIIIGLLVTMVHARAQTPKKAVDWQRGMLYAPGAAAADIRAPSPGIARLKARRVAFERATAELSKRAKALPWVDGGTLGAQLKLEHQKRRFARVLQRALARDVRYASDGSVMLQAAVGLEALRLAIVGSPIAARRAKKRITAIVVLVGKHRVAQRVGVALWSGAELYAGPTVYYRRRPGKAILGDKVLTGKVTRVDGNGNLLLGPPMTAELLKNARDSGALVAIVLPDQSR